MVWEESSSVSSLLKSHQLKKALLARDRAVDVLVWTPALSAATVEWHIWQTTPGAAAFIASEPETKDPAHKTPTRGAKTCCVWQLQVFRLK